MTPLAHLLRQRARRVAGIMSGTSTDGVDVAIAWLEGSRTNLTCQLEAFHTVPYPEDLRATLLAQTHPESSSVAEISQLHVCLGRFMASAVKKTASQAGIPLEHIHLIGSHGHTLYHHPEPGTCAGEQVHSTFQIGSPDVIAAETGIPTIGDFRMGDIAVGGQGAPLVPYFDYVYFHHPKETRLLLNIGGIANVTVLPAGGDLDAIQAFDTGPGNMVIDALSQELLHRPYDPGGSHASRGNIDLDLLAELLRHPFFQLPPPKSTGREVFGAAYAHTLLEKAHQRHLSAEDMLATATALTAHSIYRAYCDFIQPAHPADVLIVSGGGRHNAFLMNLLRTLFAPVRVHPLEDYGLSADAKEALCFAVLAHEWMNGVPTNVPRVTGARGPALLGNLSLPPTFATPRTSS